MPEPTLVTRRLPVAPDAVAPDGSDIREAVRGRTASLCHATLAPGSVSRATAHRSIEELWFCLSGTGELWRRLGERQDTVALHAGVSLNLPPHTAFQFRATGPEPLCVLIATVPPWPGGAEAEPADGPWSPTPDEAPV